MLKTPKDQKRATSPEKARGMKRAKRKKTTISLERASDPKTSMPFKRATPRKKTKKEKRLDRKDTGVYTTSMTKRQQSRETLRCLGGLAGAAARHRGVSFVWEEQ